MMVKIWDSNNILCPDVHKKVQKYNNYIYKVIQ